MPTEADPILGNWYRHLDKGQKFCVVALNEDEGLVEIQHFDGDLEEIDQDSWYELDLEPIEEPENWSGPVDVSETDDFGTEITDTTAEDWQEPLQEIAASDAEREEGEETGDEWGVPPPTEEPWEGER